MSKQEILYTIKALQKNGMKAEYLDSCDMLIHRLEELVSQGGQVASGSSETLSVSGVRQFFQSKNYIYYDAGDSSLSKEERDSVIRKGFTADVYLTSVAAVTQEGELLIVDGTGNRVAAMAYGPRNIFVIVGMQKIVANMKAAFTRLETIAAPQNARRRGKNELPCAKTGSCCQCKHLSRMCCYYLRIGFSREPDRIRIFIIGEKLGY